MKDLINQLILERPFLFLRYIIYALIFIGSLIGLIIKKAKNNNQQ